MSGDLQEQAKRHLWMHFTRMGSYDEPHEVPVIVRGEGCYVYDEHGKRYLDGLSALYCVNIGHGRAELGEAAARRPRSSASTRTGATPTRARSSWPCGSPSSRPAT
jgi:adenosylmethionine-8-amino-7-oxononanoate aminotransferase